MESKNFKSWEKEPIDLNIAYTDTCVPPEVMEAVHAITPTGSTGHVDLRNRPEKAGLLTPRNQLLGYNRGALMAEHSNRRGLHQSQITNFTALSRSSRHPKLSLKFKCLQRESFSASGTGVYYMPRQSSASKRYVDASTIEALSLLADVSCEVERTHLQRSCNITRKLDSDSHKERINQMPPLQNEVAFVQKNFNRPNSKGHRSDQYSRKITDTFKVVRKLRTPRRTLLRCPTTLQKNINLSKCDEILSCVWESSASFFDTAHLRDRLPMTDTLAITSACKDMIGGDKFPDVKSMSCNIDSALPAVQGVTIIEKVSKSSCQISDTMKKPFKGFKRSEWFCNKVLEFIGAMTVSEKVIRQTLGNNPDTSKALRLEEPLHIATFLAIKKRSVCSPCFSNICSFKNCTRLLTEHKVMRLGSGGRGRAYEYVATKKGLLHIQCGANQAVSEVVELTPESVSSSNPIGGDVMVASDAPKSETQCLPAQDTNCPEASVSNTNHENRSCSVTPHGSFQWPLTQTLNCVLSSQSLDVPSSGI